MRERKREDLLTIVVACIIFVLLYFLSPLAIHLDPQHPSRDAFLSLSLAFYLFLLSLRAFPSITLCTRIHISNQRDEQRHRSTTCRCMFVCTPRGCCREWREEDEERERERGRKSLRDFIFRLSAKFNAVHKF